MRDRPAKEEQLPTEIQPEPIPVYVRSHTRVRDEKPRRDGEGKLADKWANYALVFDCETTTDIRQGLNFLWWRFCERKQDTYVCQHEGLVHPHCEFNMAVKVREGHSGNTNLAGAKYWLTGDLGDEWGTDKKGTWVAVSFDPSTSKSNGMRWHR